MDDASTPKRRAKRLKVEPGKSVAIQREDSSSDESAAGTSGGESEVNSVDTDSGSENSDVEPSADEERQFSTGTTSHAIFRFRLRQRYR